MKLLCMQVINALKAENNIINTKLRRVEGENVLKVGTNIYLNLAHMAGLTFPHMTFI